MFVCACVCLIQSVMSVGVFVVFVVVDNPADVGGDSILDVRVPIFGGSIGAPPEIKTYMDFFPFPFYVILRNIRNLPAIVGDALRQWFEIVAGHR